MKKLLVLLSVSFIAVIIALSVLSLGDNTYSEIKNNSFNKTTKSYDIKVVDSRLNVKNIIDEDKKGFVLYNSWPWLPLIQFKKYYELFLNGTTLEISYNSVKK